MNLNNKNTMLVVASKLIVDLVAAFLIDIKPSHGVTRKIKLNIESTMFAGVGSEHFSNLATMQV